MHGIIGAMPSDVVPSEEDERYAPVSFVLICSSSMPCVVWNLVCPRHDWDHPAQPVGGIVFTTCVVADTGRGGTIE